jgi:hypothetical protein
MNIQIDARPFQVISKYLTLPDLNMRRSAFNCSLEVDYARREVLGHVEPMLGIDL